jgi:hypothetical protein
MPSGTRAHDAGRWTAGIAMGPTPQVLVYQALMEGIKKRTACLRRLAKGELSLGDERLNWELAALQLRMVLESIRKLPRQGDSAKGDSPAD